MVGLSLLAALLAASAVFAIMVGIRQLYAGRASLQERIEGFVQRPQAVSLEELELQEPFFDRVVQPLIRGVSSVVGRLLPRSNLRRIRRELLLAGSPWGLSPIDFLGLRFLGSVALGGGGLFLGLSMDWSPLQLLLVTVVLLATGFYTPVYWLRKRIASRQDEILRALPDALDMLTICVDAGLSFDLAMLKISEKWDNAVAQEFNRVVAEIRMGLSREDALRHLAERTGVTDVGNFVAVLIQADQLGVSIADVLHVQSDQMRERRRQRAEELANQAPVKMVFPLVLLVLPALFIMILGPAVPGFIESISALTGR